MNLGYLFMTIIWSKTLFCILWWSCELSGKVLKGWSTRCLKINHFAKVIGMFMKVQNLQFEIQFHETKSFFQSIWLFFGSPKQIVIIRHPGSENGEKMLLLMGLFEQKRLLATFIPNPWQLQLHYMSRCQRVVEDWASMRLTFKIQSHRTRSPIFRKQHISGFRVLRKDENATKKVEKTGKGTLNVALDCLFWTHLDSV